ncbi:4003_t:CDS:2 [Entrophospora sp. SA101]|nr:4003_t:CDS:2 [Entrophospora sp. SA101]CAJ0847064.1 6445_t:CDS:2 [Entrophospora sp. SA101]
MNLQKIASPVTTSPQSPFSTSSLSSPDSSTPKQVPPIRRSLNGKRHNNTNEQSTPSLLIEPAPAPAMYWTKIKTNGKIPKALRGHTVNLVGELMYVFGGRDLLIGEAPPPCRAHSSTLVDKKLFIFGGGDGSVYFNHLYIFDTDTLSWSKPETTGDIPLPRRAHTTAYYNNSIYVFGGGDGARALNDVHIIVIGEAPPPCRAHSSTLVDKKLFIFGGGDGSVYFNHLYIFDTDTLSWSKPETTGDIPLPRRAHTTAYYNNSIYVFGGGDGARALNDVHMLNVSDLNNLVWKKVEPSGRAPISRGYHTSNLVGSKLVVYGGSDGLECFSDVHILDLVTMQWESRKVYGTRPTERGYHSSVLYDSRLFVFGGYDGQTVYDDLYVLDLSACAYLPQIINFELPEIYNK